MQAAMGSKATTDAAGVLRRWFEEVWNQGRMETIDELFPTHAVLWGTGRPDASSTGPAEFKEFYKGLRAACPDIRITVEDVVQEGDIAFARWTARMTHTGEGLGMPATNRAIALSGMSACRAKDGKLAEGWNVWDQLGMLRELGVLNGPAAEMFK